MIDGTIKLTGGTEFKVRLDMNTLAKIVVGEEENEIKATGGIIDNKTI
jgi:hypothetical protein